MADILIRHLKHKGDGHSALATLVNQWGFDKELIPKALQTIGSLFPHFSRHDESHSQQILVNIERLLGDSIEQLTATDTWLILEAAYWHDIGMVVPQKDIDIAVDSPEFQNYLASICSQPNHELYRFAKNFDLRNISKCFKGADTPIETTLKFRQLMAEWFRQQHPARAEQIVQTPWERAGINSPRTELIPARLFKLLGRICTMHGKPFREILGPDGLAYKEAGLAQEDCHPRFVACLLRMGDLLDLDDNRFCPVMQRIAGEHRPHLSKAHEDKHAGIRHLRIDRERIEISAECETIEGYLETFKWFDWLKQEMQDQMAHWQDIAPSRELGLLPTLGTVSVRLSGEQQILEEGQRPQFSIDGANTIKLLQGSNLYSTDFACIRELLQNAIDATLLRLWLTERGSMSEQDWESPFSEKVSKILKKALVQVELTEMPRAADTPEGKSPWILRIHDQGTGISRTDLTHMLNIGGSQRNITRQKMISTMPEWMKPSGAFGIGFQSAFLICDQVQLTTKSIVSNETLQITMHSPTGNKEGLTLIHPQSNDASVPCGTTIQIRLLLDTFAESWTISYGRETSIAEHFIESMDPVLDDSFPYIAAKLADEIRKFAKESPIPIKATLTTKPNSTLDLTADLIRDDNTDFQWKFINADDYAVAIKYLPVCNISPSIDALYRGQPFEYKSSLFPHVRMAINLLSGNAGQWLTASREKLASHADESFKRIALLALEQQVRKDIDDTNCPWLTPENRPTFSLFLKAMALQFGNDWERLSQRLGDAWLDLPCNDTGTDTFRSFFDKDDWVLGEISSAREQPLPNADVLASNSRANRTLQIILDEWLKIEGRTIHIQRPDFHSGSNTSHQAQSINQLSTTPPISSHDQKYGVQYRLKKSAQMPYSKEALAARLVGLAKEGSTNRRLILNCDSAWKKLFLHNETPIWASEVFAVTTHNTSPVLLPFLYRKPLGRKAMTIEASPTQLDALCKWVEPHLQIPSPLVDIRRTYDKLIDYVDNDIMRPSLYWDFWKTARGID